MRRLADLLFWLLALGAVVLVVLFGLLLGGAIGAEPAGPDAAPAPTVAAATGTPTTAAPRERASSAPSGRQPSPRSTLVRITATRGDCWVLARAGSEAGARLAERVLLEGETMRVRAQAVWLSLGASANVDVTVNGRPRELPFGTVEVVLRPSAQT